MRYAILAHDRWRPGGAKTGFALVRYSRLGWSKDEVVAVVDRSAKAGADASGVVGELGRGIPVVRTLQEALALGADAVAIGVAPVGGALPADWRQDVTLALERGLTFVSGLHHFLADDPELAAVARRTGARIVDVRRPPAEKRIATGEAMLLDALVVTIVGTECSSGKMTTAVELALEARARGIKVAFVATGQTGIMIGCDAGLPLDACVSDFAAGLMEKSVLEAAASGADLVIVEGQASLSHPAYSGVTLSLLHGSFPDLLVLCDEPARKSIGAFASTPVHFAVNRLGHEMHLNEALLEHVTGGHVAAISIMTPGLDDAQFRDAQRRCEMETGLPAGDVFRGGRGRILDAVLARAEKLGLWKDGRFVAGAKARKVREATRESGLSPQLAVEGRPHEA